MNDSFAAPCRTGVFQAFLRQRPNSHSATNHRVPIDTNSDDHKQGRHMSRKLMVQAQRRSAAQRHDATQSPQRWSMAELVA
eukprot:8782095-Alexandrium_andersonii.AAC.1